MTTKCEGQYLKKGYLCGETEKPSGRIHECPMIYGGECLIDRDESPSEQRETLLEEKVK